VALTGSIGPCSNLSVILSSANGSRHPPGTEAVVGETALLPEVDAGTCPVIQTPTKLATLAAIRMASAGRPGNILARRHRRRLFSVQPPDCGPSPRRVDHRGHAPPHERAMCQGINRSAAADAMTPTPRAVRVRLRAETSLPIYPILCVAVQDVSTPRRAELETASWRGRRYPVFRWSDMERTTGFEPATPTLARAGRTSLPCRHVPRPARSSHHAGTWGHVWDPLDGGGTDKVCVAR
jgi:hypothetical protein